MDEELCKAQQDLYKEYEKQKRVCKTEEDVAVFEASEPEYHERLEQIKLQKKENRKKLKAVERCLERDGSLTEAELEYRIPVDNMVDLAKVEKDAVPENPYRVQEDVVIAEPMIEPPAKEMKEPVAETIADNKRAEEFETVVENSVIETIVTDVRGEQEVVTVDDEMVLESDTDKAESVTLGLENDDIQKPDETMNLPSDKAEYMRMSVDEKVRSYPFDDKGTDAAFEMIQIYFKKMGMDTSVHSVYEEAKLLTDYYEKQKAEELIGEKAEQAIEIMKLLGVDAGRIAEYSADVLSEMFGFGDMEYFAGIKMFNRVIDRFGYPYGSAEAI